MEISIIPLTKGLALLKSEEILKLENNWVEIGDASSGVAEFRFPEGSRGKLLFVKIYESSSNTGFRFYGCVIDAELIPQ